MDTNIIIQGDCIEVMKTLPDNSVDSVVTDPPYGLVSIQKRFGKENSAPAQQGKDGSFARLSGGFMGKKWDGTGIENNVEMWKECLRVLKPGGHLLAFSGTRTYHRMAVAIEDAGFEVRDMIEWVYGSGFPKSLAVDKDIDEQYFEREARKYPEYVSKSNEFPKTKEGRASRSKWQKQFKIEKGFCRKKIGENQYKNRRPNPMNGTSYIMNETKWDCTENLNLTAPYTNEAKQWEGWGTAMKPSHESIMLAQKPLTSVPLFDKIDIDLIIKKILCLLVSNVKIAESNSVLSQRGLSEELNIAQWIAEENTNTQDALSVLTDMLLSESKTNTNLNIVILWLNILEDLYQLKNKFTTLTEISLTIELKILESLEWENIFQSITQAKDKKTDGKNVNVLTAVNLFNAVRLKLNHILTHFAQDPAILKDEYSDIRPNHEPICMARKPLAEKTVAENCLKWGTGGINIDASRVAMPDRTEYEAKQRTFKGATGKVGEASWKNSSPLNDPETSIENSKLGRFPANLIHDNSEEVKECFPENNVKGSAIRKNKVNPYGGERTWSVSDTPAQDTVGYADSGNASRFFKSIIYQAKASKSERNKGLEGREPIKVNDGRQTPIDNAFQRGETPRVNSHPTIKPIALMEYLIKMITPKGGIVLDPFAGSGSTLIAAKKNGFQYLGIEKEAEYVKIAEARLSATRVDNKLF